MPSRIGWCDTCNRTGLVEVRLDHTFERCATCGTERPIPGSCQCLPDLPCPASHYERDPACPYCRPDLWDCAKGGHVQGPGGLCAAQAWNDCDHDGGL